MFGRRKDTSGFIDVLKGGGAVPGVAVPARPANAGSILGNLAAPPAATEGINSDLRARLEARRAAAAAAAAMSAPSAAGAAVPTAPRVGLPLPGQRTMTLTYNMALFLVLIAGGAVFGAFAFGVRHGESRRAQDAAFRDVASAEPVGGTSGPSVSTTPDHPTQLPTMSDPPAAAPYALFLCSWPAGTPNDEKIARSAAVRVAEELLRQGVKADVRPFSRSGKPEIALITGSYASLNAPDLRRDITRFQTLKIQERTFFKGCGAVQVAKK